MPTKQDEIRFELIMDAGNGAQKAGDILIKSFANSGRRVFIEPLIPAEISPPKRTPHSMSGVVIRVGKDEITNIGSFSEFVFVEHEILLKRRLADSEFSKECQIFIDVAESKRFKDDFDEVIKASEDQGFKVNRFTIHEDALAIIKSLNGNGKNMYYLGCMAKVFNADKDDLIKMIKVTFKKLSEEKLNMNIDIFNLGFDHFESEPLVEVAKNEALLKGDNILLDGNTALALGVIDAGIKVFSGYPITPASTIMHNLARLFPSYGGMVHQAEDEISAIGAVLGSYFAGVPAITATSGPGLSLKQEILGLANSTEIPCILVNVQRGGPSTGLPTRTEQSDILAAAFGSHGDNTKVLLGVSNIKDCFYVPHVARYITERLRVPVIILSDYILSVSYRVIEKLKLYQLDDVNDISDEVLDRFNLKRLPDEIEMVKGNQSVPGQPDLMRRVTGLNTDENGQVSNTAESNERSQNVRNEKIHVVRRCLKEPEIIGDKSGDLLLVSWGSSRGVLAESISQARKKGYKVSGLNLKVVTPLPLQLKDIFSQFKTVGTIEVAYGDELKPAPLAMLLRSETLVEVKTLVANATGRPLKPAQIADKIKEILS